MGYVDFHFYEKSSDEFEDIIIEVCRIILGIGTIKFSKGPDGGRDGRFEGTANKFPSEKTNWSGRWIIQAKHTEKRESSCNEKEFEGLIDNEISKLKKLLEIETINNYLIFTNKKGPAKIEKIINRIKTETGIKNVEIIGEENLVSYIEKHDEIIIKHNLGSNSLRITSEDIKKLILDYSKTLNSDKIKKKLRTKKFNLNDKNIKNKLSNSYYKNMIQGKSEIYFDDIEQFLNKQKNSEFREIYEEIVFEYSSKIIASREKYKKFDDIFNILLDEILKQVPEINKKLLYVFLHFMYVHCDIGEEP